MGLYKLHRPVLSLLSHAIKMFQIINHLITSRLQYLAASEKVVKTRILFAMEPLYIA